LTKLGTTGATATATAASARQLNPFACSPFVEMRSWL
jgi:hypothetical protein